MVKINNIEEFDNLIKDGVCLVKVGSEFCGPCKVTSKNIESVEKDYPNVKFIDVDAEENEDVSEKLNIRNVPTLIKFVDGIEETRYTGLMTVNKLIDFFK
jgi:thioredoxin 1